jgi:hypothetical protein
MGKVVLVAIDLFFVYLDPCYFQSQVYIGAQ